MKAVDGFLLACISIGIASMLYCAAMAVGH